MGTRAKISRNWPLKPGLSRDSDEPLDLRLKAIMPIRPAASIWTHPPPAGFGLRGVAIRRNGGRSAPRSRKPATSAPHRRDRLHGPAMNVLPRPARASTPLRGWRLGCEAHLKAEFTQGADWLRAAERGSARGQALQRTAWRPLRRSARDAANLRQPDHILKRPGDDTFQSRLRPRRFFKIEDLHHWATYGGGALRLQPRRNRAPVGEPENRQHQSGPVMSRHLGEPGPTASSS